MTSRKRRTPLYAKIPLAILLWPYIVFDVLNDIRKERQNEKRAAAKKLPRRRKRALTLPLPDRPWCLKRQRTYDQFQSPLFNRLVWDVRQLIYEYVLAPDERELHLGKTEGRLCSIRCHSEDSTQETWQHECWQPHLINWAEYFAHSLPPLSSESRITNVIGLLSSCRQMWVYSKILCSFIFFSYCFRYSESIAILYTRNRFNIRQTRVTMELPNVILPHRLANIQSLNIDLLPISSMHINFSEFSVRWKHSCTVFSMMEQLRILHVTITQRVHGYVSNYVTDENMISILQPLWKVKAQDFEVRLSRWPKLSEAVSNIIGENPPFRLTERDILVLD